MKSIDCATAPFYITRRCSPASFMVSFLAAAVERHALKCCVPDMRPVSLLSSLLLATQRTRASMPHRGSKETILSESRDVAKMKKDSMTAIFPLYCKNILQNKNRQRPTFPGSFPPSIIGAKELNYCVRDGNRCDLLAIVTGFLAC